MVIPCCRYPANIYLEYIMKPKDKPHYVNNREFSQACVDYVKLVHQAEADEKPTPIVPDYIARCFLRIAEGLSHKSNFVRYTYREEMVMDAVENCLKAILNYNINTATRTGNPNAFAYFTQICYYAFLRRLAKEKKQQDIKFKFIEEAGLEDFVAFGEDVDHIDANGEMAYVDQLKDRIEKVRTTDKMIKEYAERDKKQHKEPKNLEMFMGS